MYEVTAGFSFDSAHLLPGHDGKCRNLHGHRWTVNVTLKQDNLIQEGSSEGMVLDFGDLKKYLKHHELDFDHALIIQKGSISDNLKDALLNEGVRVVFVDFRTTAENMAKFFYDRLKYQYCYPVCRVEVYETPNNKAVYYEEDVHECACSKNS